MTQWFDCGCFVAEDLKVDWKCAKHRGVGEAERKAIEQREQDDLKVEADAWLKWAGGSKGPA